VETFAASTAAVDPSLRWDDRKTSPFRLRDIEWDLETGEI